MRRPTLHPVRGALLAALASSAAFAVTPVADAPVSSPKGASPAPSVVSRVDRANLERIVAKLSGSDTVAFADDTIHINTRYASSPLMPRVREYLVREIRSAGYEPELRKFLLRVDVPELTGTAISSGLDTLWVTDVNGVVYRGAAPDWAARFERIGVIDATVLGLERDPSGRLWAYGRFPGTAYGALYRSADGGATWNLRYTGTQTYTLATITFSDGQFCMAGGSGGSVIRSWDGGESWAPVDASKVGYQGLAGSASTGPRHFWFVSDFGTLFDTPDLGDTWRTRPLVSGLLTAIDFHGESTGVIVGDGRAFYTRDAGESWTQVAVPAELTAVEMVDSLRVVAGGRAGEIWISEDGGAVWERFGAECGVTQDVWSLVPAGRDTFWLAGRDVVRMISDAGGERTCEEHAFADTIWSMNVVFRREGEVDPSRRVILGAHYDSYSGSTPLVCAPGADDNATGTSAVIECARVLRSERLERTVEFVLFDAEEVGLLGSRAFAAALEPGVVYDGVLNLDMIGWEPNAEMTALISGRDSVPGDSVIARAISAAVDSFDLALGTTYLEGVLLTSDHVPFWEAGIPAVLLVEGSRDELTPYYHSCSDGATTISYAFHETCTKAALGAVSLLAGLLPAEQPPPALALRQNYPNPFNMGTMIRYSLPEAFPVEIAVFDAAGRRVAVIDAGLGQAGENVCRWDGRDLRGDLVQSGVYFLRLRAGGGEATRKMVVVR